VGQLILAATSVIAGVATFWTEPAVLVAGLVCALTCGLAFFVVHMISRGGLGFGDVKLAMICGWWLGLGSMTMVIAGMIVACLLALGYSVISKVKVFAFGPWLVVGTILAGLVLPPWSHL
jgi:leader peptidase (prepilin peptidase)/N-methyltransferase